MNKGSLWFADQSNRELFRANLVDVASGELGVSESPAGSNKVKYAKWYGLNGYSWCAMTVSWFYDQVSVKLNVENPSAGLQSVKGFAGVTSGFATAKTRGWTVLNNPLPGDIVCWDHDNIPGGNGHTGLVIAVNSMGFTVVEGNTNDKFSRTGGSVMKHDHMLNDGKHGRLLGFIRPSRKFFVPPVS